MVAFDQLLFAVSFQVRRPFLYAYRSILTDSLIRESMKIVTKRRITNNACLL